MSGMCDMLVREVIRLLGAPMCKFPYSIPVTLLLNITGTYITDVIVMM